MGNWWNNQEYYALKMPQVILHDAEIEGIPFSLDDSMLIAELNRTTLDSMYRMQYAIYKLFSGCDIREIVSNTISPAQQNIFVPLKVWRVNLGGCFAEVSIYQRVLDGCYVGFAIL